MIFEDWRDAAAQKLYENCGRILAKWEEHWARQAWDAATKAAQPQWRPIETAPKDGRPVMLRRNIALIERISNGAYITDLTGGYWMWRPIAIGQPTHWMPLPPAPEKTATGEKEQEARDVTR